MQTLPDYWFVYIPPDWDDVDFPELIAMSPQMSWGHLGLPARSMLAWAGAYFKRHPAHRVVFFADVIAWLRSDYELEWSSFGIDMDEAWADIYRNGPALGMLVDAIVMGVALSGQRPLRISVADGTAIDVADHDSQVRAELIREITANWHIACDVFSTTAR